MSEYRPKINIDYEAMIGSLPDSCAGSPFKVNFVYGTNTVDVFSNRYKPVRVIYNDPMTICYFADGSKVTVKTMAGEIFTKEGGVMNCIIKKLYGNHSEFKRLVDSGTETKKKEVKDPCPVCGKRECDFTLVK